MTEIIHIDPQDIKQEDLLRAAKYLKDGQVIGYPTETIYGLGGDVFNHKSIKRIYDLKSRDYGLPIAVLVSDLDMLKDVVVSVPDYVIPIMKKFWPGPLTICFTASANIPKDLVSNTGKIGVRISSHPVATGIVKVFGRPITTTSANLTDFPPSLCVKHIVKYFGEKVPCIVDSGECEPSRGSTVIDLADDSMRVIRDGAIPANEVISCFQNE